MTVPAAPPGSGACPTTWRPWRATGRSPGTRGSRGSRRPPRSTCTPGTRPSGSTWSPASATSRSRSTASWWPRPTARTPCSRPGPDPLVPPAGGRPHRTTWSPRRRPPVPLQGHGPLLVGPGGRQGAPATCLVLPGPHPGVPRRQGPPVLLQREGRPHHRRRPPTPPRHPLVGAESARFSILPDSGCGRQDVCAHPWLRHGCRWLILGGAGSAGAPPRIYVLSSSRLCQRPSRGQQPLHRLLVRLRAVASRQIRSTSSTAPRAHTAGRAARPAPPGR